MAELLDEKWDSMLELLLVSVSAEDAWLDVDALSEPEPPLPPQALNSDSNSGMQSIVKGAELDVPVHDIKDSPVVKFRHIDNVVLRSKLPLCSEEIFYQSTHFPFLARPTTWRCQRVCSRSNAVTTTITGVMFVVLVRLCLLLVVRRA